MRLAHLRRRSCRRGSGAADGGVSGWTESPEATAALKNVIAAFEATHPTIDVEYQPSHN
jgi:ABC-type glycerol-3-phosphate transport system substrate-binding protein